MAERFLRSYILSHKESTDMSEKLLMFTLYQLIFSLQVMINGNLEKRIIDVINKHKNQNDDKGMISKRLTAKKLQVQFKVLFSIIHVE